MRASSVRRSTRLTSFRDLAGTGRVRPQQAGDDLPQLRDSDGRLFPPPTGFSLGSRTTEPTTTGSCGGASPPNSAVHNGLALPRLCLPATVLRCDDADRGRSPPFPGAPRPARSKACTRFAALVRPSVSPPIARAGRSGRLGRGFAPKLLSPAPLSVP